MKTPIAIAAALLAAPLLAAEQGYYRVELAPSGSTIASDRPVADGNQYVFHEYPSGTLVSVRRDEVRAVVAISTGEAEKSNPARNLISIGTLAMEGSSQAGPQNLSAARGAVGANNWFYQGTPGVTDAWAPANAVVASPGAPPTAPPR
jgi:hypothetical protein